VPPCDAPFVGTLVGSEWRGTMPKIVRHQLRAKQVEKLAAPGVYQDGGGLQLRVRNTGAKFWVLRTTAKGKRRDKGLGSFPNVSLEEARAKADAVRRAIKSGVPTPATRTELGITLKEAFDTCWRSKRLTLTNAKHRQQWESTMATYVFPKIGHMSVADIRAGEIVDVLRPIWATKPETARRILQRLEFVFRAAIRREWRERASPTVGVREELGSMRKVAKHFRSLSYQDVPAFLSLLRNLSPTPARLCLQFVVLTACRSGEARFAVWTEIVGGQWIIPAERTKMRRQHIVPLSDAAKEVLELARNLPRATGCHLIFPGSMTCNPLSDMAMTKSLRDLGFAEAATVHGFRSSFRTWCAEVARCRPEVAEAALAHTIKDKVEAAYRRAEYLEERKALMSKWGRFLNDQSRPRAHRQISGDTLRAPAS
jgi:integrase